MTVLTNYKSDPSPSPEMVEVKRCRGCGEVKPLSEFYVNRGKPRANCKPCYLEYQRNWKSSTKAGRRAAKKAREAKRKAGTLHVPSKIKEPELVYSGPATMVLGNHLSNREMRKQLRSALLQLQRLDDGTTVSLSLRRA